MRKLAFVVVAILAVLTWSALYIVDEREIAIKFRLGEIVSIFCTFVDVEIIIMNHDFVKMHMYGRIRCFRPNLVAYIKCCNEQYWHHLLLHFVWNYR